MLNWYPVSGQMFHIDLTLDLIPVLQSEDNNTTLFDMDLILLFFILKQVTGAYNQKQDCFTFNFSKFIIYDIQTSIKINTHPWLKSLIKGYHSVVTHESVT